MVSNRNQELALLVAFIFEKELAKCVHIYRIHENGMGVLIYVMPTNLIPVSYFHVNGGCSTSFLSITHA